MITLATTVESAPRISKKILPALKRLGIRTVLDLLFHFPARYDDFSNQKNIRDAAEDEIATIQGVIVKMSSGYTARKKMHVTTAAIQDNTGAVQATWFNQRFLARTLKIGARVSLSGKISRGPKGLCLQNPAYEKVSGARHAASNAAGIHTGRLVPVYPETSGISSRWLRFLMHLFLPLAQNMQDPLPPETQKTYGLPEIKKAIRDIHFPGTRASAAAAERRFMFEELLLMQLRAMRERARLKQRVAPAIALDVALMKKFVSFLPFSLTDAQRRSIYEIARDMTQARPMNRLLEGDVGSGKTIVAAAASLLAVRSGYKVAFMAPTEILARQHHATINRALEPFHVTVGLLTGSEKKIKGAPDVTVGTHALIHLVRSKPPKATSAAPEAQRTSNGVQKNAFWENLGLVIVDEQHRFGVSQRAMLAAGNGRQETISQKTLPHFLSMTATPIPRTLALTIYGDLDISILDQMPASRKTTITKIIAPEKRSAACQFIRAEVQRGRQVFVICPRIEVTDKKSETNPDPSNIKLPSQQKLLFAEAKTVKEEFRRLSEEVFPDLRVAMLHGRMKAKEKSAVMRGFHDGKTDILVSTSVIEVGVDVANATIMMIEGAERFGLSQLHQFRGRVGRGTSQSYCFLFPTEGGPASRRLKAVVDAKNGFELAEYDLKIRGPGDLFGTEQWGEAGMAIKGLADPNLVREVRSAAVEIVQHSPDLSGYPLLLARLQEMEKTLHLE